MSRQWYQDAVFYEIFVRSFYDSNGDGWGDLPGVTAKLDYLQWLGVDCIWLLPFFDSPLKDGGYDVRDFYKIHPKYGTLDDFKTLIREAHARDIKVIGDLVLNHTSDENPWFQEARDPSSPRHDWYVWSETTEKYADARVIFPDYEDSNWQWDEKAGKYYWHRFFRFQPDLNYDNPEVQQEMINIAKYWLELGLDGFRLDAVPHLFERDGTNCENLPETHAFLRHLRHEVEKVKPDAVLLAETNQIPEKLLAYFNDGDECNMAFDFPVMVDIFNAIRKGNGKELLQAVEETPVLPPGCQWGLFLRNHDELSTKHLSVEEHAAFMAHYASAPEARFKAGLRRRLAPMFDFSLDKLKLAYALLLTLPGTPVLYYGDELGMGDDLTLDDRNSVRTPMPWNANENAGFSTSKTLPLPIVDGRGGYRTINVAKSQEEASLLTWLREMLHIRKLHSVLQSGDFRAVPTPHSGLSVYERISSEQRIRVVVNLTSQKHAITDYKMGDTLAENGLDGEVLRPYGFCLYESAV